MRKSKGRKARESKGLLNYLKNNKDDPTLENGTINLEGIEDFMEKVFAPSRRAVRNLVKELTLWDGDLAIDKGTADYFIEKYSGTGLDGIPLYFTRGDQAFICTIGFLRQLKTAHKDSIQHSTEII